jgi:glycosyltransferase involved in cell wall biosynthesis
MRVLFLALYPELAASSRYRVHQFLPYLDAAGVQCDVVSPLTNDEWRLHTGPDRKGRAFWYHAKETPRRIAQLFAASRYDIVVIQKAIMTAYVRGMMPLLTSRAKRIVYDIDDAVHLGPPHPLRPPWRFLEDHRQIEKLMRGADLVLAGNEWLVEEARQFAPRVEYFPTVVDAERFSPVKPEPNSFTIGWMGSQSTTTHLAPAIDALRNESNATIRLVGADAAFGELPQAQIVAWSFDREVDELHAFSVGIMPVPESPWTRGKCALKALQYMACGVPCIATPFGAICSIIEHGKNGLFANTTDEWRSAFAHLRDPAERARIGLAARRTVEEHYSLAIAAPRLKYFLESVL